MERKENKRFALRRDSCEIGFAKLFNDSRSRFLDLTIEKISLDCPIALIFVRISIYFPFVFLQ